MDVAWAQGSSPADSDFHLLAAVPDFNAHWQGNQQNFTMLVTLPQVESDHVTLRVRYDPHSCVCVCAYAYVSVCSDQLDCMQRLNKVFPAVNY